MKKLFLISLFINILFGFSNEELLSIINNMCKEQTIKSDIAIASEIKNICDVNVTIINQLPQETKKKLDIYIEKIRNLNSKIEVLKKKIKKIESKKNITKSNKEKLKILKTKLETQQSKLENIKEEFKKFKNILNIKIEKIKETIIKLEKQNKIQRERIKKNENNIQNIRNNLIKFVEEKLNETENIRKKELEKTEDRLKELEEEIEELRNKLKNKSSFNLGLIIEASGSDSTRYFTNGGIEITSRFLDKNLSFFGDILYSNFENSFKYKVFDIEEEDSNNNDLLMIKIGYRYIFQKLESISSFLYISHSVGYIFKDKNGFILDLMGIGITNKRYFIDIGCRYINLEYRDDIEFNPFGNATISNKKVLFQPYIKVLWSF